MVQAGQTSPCYDADFYPFGGERDITSTCTQNYKFEGKERDTETGNDDFGARYYASRIGRWLSADWSAVPAPVPYANLTNPQTLNLYAMVSDNPETFADLDGHDQSSPGSNGTPPSAVLGAEQPTSQSSCVSVAGSGDPSGFEICNYTGQTPQVSTDQENAQNKAKEAQNQNQAQQQKTDNVPSKFVIEPQEIENKGYYSIYHYQLQNKEGQALTGTGYSVEEHIDASHTSVPQQTSEGQFTPVAHGEVPDRVGKAAPPPKGYKQDSITYQTFTVRYKATNYNLSTVFKHEIIVSKGVVTTHVTDVVP